MKKALVFSGQGSQYVGMAKDLFENFDIAKEILKEANNILGYDIQKIMFEGPIETLKETRYTQPAIYLHSSIIYEIMKDKIDFEATAGHSVGEYAALHASGVIDLFDGLKLVAKRGELMFDAGLEQPGTMFAVINLEDEKVISVCEELTKNGNGNVVVAANFNSPGQVVVSGSAEYLRANVEKFKEAGARMVKELVVSGAFHSPLLNSARQSLAEAINNTHFNDAKKTIYTNVTASSRRDANTIKEDLIKQLTYPVKWTQTVIQLQKDGIDTFIEMGPGNVLQGLIKRTINDVEISGIEKIENIENYQ